MTRARKCRHLESVTIMWQATIHAEPRETVIGYALSCQDCMEWLPMGPSNDSHSLLDRELELADCIADTCQLWEPKHQDTRIQVWIDLVLAEDAGHTHPGDP